jgi:general secretion pathway protein H
MQCRRLRTCRGFTLIEILVVVTIIGIIISAVTLAVGPSRLEILKQETRRLAALIQLSQEEAILQSRDLGLAFWKNGYTFYELEIDSLTWHKIEKDRSLRSYTLPDNMQAQLTLEGIDIIMAVVEQEAAVEEEEEKEEDEKKEKQKPHVFILSSGEMSPFKLRFNFPDKISEYFEINADVLGELTLSDSTKDEDAKR